MNKKAFTTPIGFFFVVLIFVFIWAFFLTKLYGVVYESAVIGGATGLELFFYANMNLWTFIGLFISVLAYGYFGGNS